MILSGDIGGTHTRLALFEEVGELKILFQEKFKNCDFKSFEDVVESFLSKHKIAVSKACFGVAGPVQNEICKATNLPWLINAKKIEKRFEITKVILRNDLEAGVMGLACLTKTDLFCLNKGDVTIGNQTLISAGTGLGVAGLLWNGKERVAFATESGHADFSPQNDLEIQLLKYLEKTFGRVSWERALSGPGITYLYQFLIDTKKEKMLPVTQEAMKNRDKTAVICELGSNKTDPACARALDLFCSLYGSFAGNAALQFLSVGGVFLGGGIAPRLSNELLRGNFYKSFCNKGRFKELLEKIPIHIVMNETVSLLGAALIVYPNNLKKRFLTASAWQQIFCPHSRFA